MKTLKWANQLVCLATGIGLLYATINMLPEHEVKNMEYILWSKAELYCMRNAQRWANSADDCRRAAQAAKIDI